MPTYGVMQTRILDEVLGAATILHAVNAIQDAVKKYERRRFWFNEVRYAADGIVDGLGNSVTDNLGNQLTSGGLATVYGQEFYTGANFAVLTSMPHIDLVSIVVGNERYPLRWRDAQELEEMSVSLNSMGRPTDWTYFNQSMRFYPIPDDAYAITIIGTFRWPVLQFANDANPWTTEAEELIRMSAESVLFRRINRDMQMATSSAQDEAQALASLRKETASRGGPKRLRAHY